jgi:hypothetical protein
MINGMEFGFVPEWRVRSQTLRAQSVKPDREEETRMPIIVQELLLVALLMAVVLLSARV